METGQSSMIEDPAVPLDFPRRDLEQAIVVAVARDGALLDAAEHAVIRAWLGLPHPAASLYARLFGRLDRPLRLDTLRYPELDDVGGAAQVLVGAGLALRVDLDDPVARLLEAYTVVQLRGACRALGLPLGGDRAQLQARLDLPSTRAVLPGAVLRLLHRPLFRRLARLYLHDHRGDLSRLVVQRMGLIRYPEYVPTGGPGLFPHRQDLLDYEQALGRRERIDTPQAAVDELPRALAAVVRSPPADPLRVRFSARRFEESIVRQGARELERQGQLRAASAAYQALLDAGCRHPARVGRRLALCLDRLGDPAQGTGICASLRDQACPSEQRAIERTGRRLARRADLSWQGLPPLTQAPTYSLSLPASPRVGPRPTYGAGVSPVESAVVQLLAQQGRRGIHAEAAPWSTLFALLFYDILFTPVAGALPSPLLTAPLDLATPLFYPRRRSAIDALLLRIARGEAPALLSPALQAHHGQAIAGARWDVCTPADLLSIVQSIPGPALAAVLAEFATDWRHAAPGLPDLIVLPGPSTRLPGASCWELPPGLFLAELKGPGDHLRDAQRVWLDRLLRLGLSAQVWQINPVDPASDDGRPEPVPHTEAP